MAYASPQYGYHQQAGEGAINSKASSYFHGDDSDILDSGILDAELMSSPEAQLRRGSLANSNGVLSPTESQGWEPHYNSGLAAEAGPPGAPSAFQDEHNGFVRLDPPHIQTYVGQPHPQNWAYGHGSGHVTPTTGVEFPPHHPGQAPFTGVPLQQYDMDHPHGSFTHPPPHPTGPPQLVNAPPFSDSHYIPATQMPTPMSPHSHADWKTMHRHEMANRPMSKRMRPSSPPRTSVDAQRRDGIRKKNGRIDIPQERSIENIDHLIETAENEDLVKELKQQKRLLRNREAALASRQRKKRHTEDLETQQKEYGQVMANLQEQNSSLKITLQGCERRYQDCLHTIHDLQGRMQTMTQEHNETTGQLRRQVEMLRNQLEAGPAPPMSANPSSLGGDITAGMDVLSMDNLNMSIGPWDDFLQMNDSHQASPLDFDFDPKPAPVHQSPVQEKRPTPSNVATAAPQKPGDDTRDPPVASGLLFFLLLCGAFVASKPASSRPTDLPHVPDDVRAAAPALLDNLLSDAAPMAVHQSSRTAHRSPHEPVMSMSPQHSTRTSSRLDRMHRRITSPTKQQKMDQAFSLTTAQYASISEPDFHAHDDFAGRNRHHAPASSFARPRSSLAETMARSRQELARSSKAEVYTRSLLWDRVPADTIRQFKEMVRDHNELEARQKQQAQQQHGTHDDDDDNEMFTYKVET